jgi:hypothetical protein
MVVNMQRKTMDEIDWAIYLFKGNVKKVTTLDGDLLCTGSPSPLFSGSDPQVFGDEQQQEQTSLPSLQAMKMGSIITQPRMYNPLSIQFDEFQGNTSPVS